MESFEVERPLNWIRASTGATGTGVQRQAPRKRDTAASVLNMFGGAASNEVRTSKYRWYSFIPLNLYEQFHSPANVYFLLTSILQTIPSISITSGRPYLLLPLGFVLIVGAARDLFEDEKKKAADRAENERHVTQIREESGMHWTIQWREVQPGNIIRIHRGELVPADTLLIASSASNNGCAVETANLDGETDHKPKVSAFPQGSSWGVAAAYNIELEPPSADLYEFRGALERPGEPRTGIGINNLLLRGCTLQQVEWVDGYVCYCGCDTRVMKNQQGARFKLSQLDMELNSVIFVIFVVQLLLCVAGGISYVVWEYFDFRQSWYLAPSNRKSAQGDYIMKCLEKVGTWQLQLSNMVPISLLVMLTVVKFCQGSLLQYDAACYDVKRRRAAEVHTSQVLESLGQVSHIFSDKTGTLTCNEMVYKACAVNDTMYGLTQSDRLDGVGDMESARTTPRLHVDFAGGRAALLKDIEKAQLQGEESRLISFINFLMCHALCHTVNVQVDDESVGSRALGTPITYVASSPDELALVWAAHDLGLSFRGKSQQSLVLEVLDAGLITPLSLACGSPATGSCPFALQLELLQVCEFDNYRKRMAVVVRYLDGRKILLVKGADNAIIPHLPAQSRHLAETQVHHFAVTGLRTLCLAYRELADDEYATWSASYADALALLSEDRAAIVQRLACDLETADGLKFLGVTAIEDRLQEGVPDTLDATRRAGITVWVLTGDKMETAISIGKSCRLITKDMSNTEIMGERSEVLAALNTFEQSGPIANERAITITGSALGFLLDSDLRQRFYKMARGCQTVICCRVSPKQKADVVQLVKDLHEGETGDKPITLAIGDGANDVSMITVAHVGVGLSGKEGAQAARVADFALGQFRFLRRLLFVHGRESYRRNSVLICYNFYKNMVVVLVPAFFAPMVAFSGQPFYEQLLYQLYNVAFTFWPCVFYAVLDRPIHNLTELEEDIRWYGPGLQKQFFNLNVFLHWVASATLQGALIPWAAFNALGHAGKPAGIGPAPDSLWLSGTAAFFWVVLGVNLTLWCRLSINMPLNVAIIVASILLFPVFVFMTEKVGSPYLRGVFVCLFGQNNLQFLVTTMLVVCMFLALGEPLICRTTPSQLAVGAP